MASRAGGRSQRAGPSQSQRRQEQIEDVDEDVYEDGDVEMNGEDGNSAGDVWIYYHCSNDSKPIR
jgi:hypothetical protein